VWFGLAGVLADIQYLRLVPLCSTCNLVLTP
jgi:hypothetical protein